MKNAVKTVPLVRKLIYLKKINVFVVTNSVDLNGAAFCLKKAPSF